MLYSNNFLNEFRSTVKEMLLNGDISDICKVKELLEYSNVEFGDFIKPLLKDDCSVSETMGSDSKNDLVAIDMETCGNSFGAHSFDGKHIFLSNKVVTMSAESRHGHYAEDGTYTEIPMEVHPQVGYVDEEEPKKVKPKYMPYFHDTTSPGQKEGVGVPMPLGG